MKKKIKEVLAELFDTKTFEFTPRGEYGVGKNETPDEITSKKTTDVLAQMIKQAPDHLTPMGGYGGSAFLSEKEDKNGK